MGFSREDTNKSPFLFFFNPKIANPLEFQKQGNPQT